MVFTFVAAWFGKKSSLSTMMINFKQGFQFGWKNNHQGQLVGERDNLWVSTKSDIEAKVMN